MTPVCSVCSCPWDIKRHNYETCLRGDAHSMLPVPSNTGYFYCPEHDGRVGEP